MFGPSVEDVVTCNSFVGDDGCGLVRGITSVTVGEALRMLALVAVGPVVNWDRN